MNASIIITISDEGARQLQACLCSIRSVYRSISIHVISDGIDDPLYAGVCSRYCASYNLGRYLKRLECGGLWWRRFLCDALMLKTKWIFKMDPDARLWRPFKGEPKYSLSGTLECHNSVCEHVQGGVQVIHADLAQSILSSGILDDEVLTLPNQYFPNRDANFIQWFAHGFLTTDFTMMYIVKSLNASYGNWSEVGSYWKKSPTNSGFRFAATHPHKMKIPTGVSADTSLHIIATQITGPLNRAALSFWLEDPLVDVTVVGNLLHQDMEYFKSQNVVDRIREVPVNDCHGLTLSRARNTGAANAPLGWWCFFDESLQLKPGWSNAIRSALIPGRYHIPEPLKQGMSGYAVLESSSYFKTDGYDELILKDEDFDFYASLRHVAVRPTIWPGQYAISNRDTSSSWPGESQIECKYFDKDAIGYYLRQKAKFISDYGRFPSIEEKQEMRAKCQLGLMPD